MFKYLQFQYFFKLHFKKKSNVQTAGLHDLTGVQPLETAVPSQYTALILILVTVHKSQPIDY